MNVVKIEWEVPLPAPAKLNLFLHVVGRRVDGYHLLQTVFRLIDRMDMLRFSPRGDREVRLAQPLPGVPEAQDLVVRAARLLQGEIANAPGVTIHIEKRLPIGGGLGGGSSDAATTLLALNTLWGLGLSVDRLATLGLQLGADVPVFVRGRSAFAEGVGEALVAVTLPPRWYVVLVPQVPVPTGEIFADPTLTRDTEQTTIAAFFAEQKSTEDCAKTAQSAESRSIGKPSEILSACSLFGQNDLEAVVRRRYPEVERHLRWLAQFGPARMSGSGCCVFAEFASVAAAEAVLARRPENMGGFVARGLDCHPLWGG